MIRMGSDWFRCEEKSCRLTTSCNECPVPVFSSICFLRLWFRWVQLRGAPTSTDDGRNFPLLRFPNAIVFPSIYLFRIWLQIGPDARKNAKQADDIMQRMSRFSLFFHLLFANSVQMGSDTRSPHFHRRRRTVCVRLGGWERGQQSRWAHMGRRWQKVSALISWALEVTTHG